VRGSAALIVPHQIIKDELVSRLHADPSRVYVVNHGVDHDLYFPRPELVRPTRKVVYLGEVSRSKGVDLLLRAFAIVNRRLPDTELVIAGKPSKDHELLQELTRTLAVTNITHMGYISEQELPGYYADASVMVFPSRCGFGLSTLEAMACGTPVVALSVLDAPEFIGDAGMLVPPDDERALADSVLRVLTEPELQKKLAEKGIARARQFSWKKMAERSLKVYEDVLRGKTTGSVD
jgi:glycosyltransferase involved in cell wall biosynthesis